MKKNSQSFDNLFLYFSLICSLRLSTSRIFYPNLVLSCLSLFNSYGLKLYFFYFSRAYSACSIRFVIFSSISFIWSRNRLNPPVMSYFSVFWIFLIPAISFFSTLHYFYLWFFASFLTCISSSFDALSFLTLLWPSLTMVSLGSDFKRIRGDAMSLTEEGGDTICLVYMFLWDRTRCSMPSGHLFLTKY